MDTREHIGIGVECVTVAVSAWYLGFIVRNSVCVCVSLCAFVYVCVCINGRGKDKNRMRFSDNKWLDFEMEN